MLALALLLKLSIQTDTLLHIRKAIRRKIVLAYDFTLTFIGHAEE